MDTKIENNIDETVKIHDVKGRKCKKGRILCILAILIIAVSALLTVIFLNKNKDNPGKHFKKTTYFYGKSTAKIEGPMSIIIRFDKDGKYMTVSTSPSQYGEVGTYEISNNKITLNSTYAYSTANGLTANISTVKSTGTYKNNEIEIFKYKFTKVEKEEFDKYNTGNYTYTDIEKAYQNGGKTDGPSDIKDDLFTYCDGLETGVVSSKDHAFNIKYESDENKSNIKVIITNEENKEIINTTCFIKDKGHMFRYAVNSDDTITTVVAVDSNRNIIPDEQTEGKYIVGVFDFNGDKTLTKELTCTYGEPQAISDQEAVCPEVTD